MRNPSSSRRGFSLIELLVVIAIIAVLIGMLLPAIQQIRQSAAKTKCQNNMRQLGVAVNGFVGDFNVLPVYYGVQVGSKASSAYPSVANNNVGQPFGGWALHLLPYIDQKNAYNLVAASDQNAAAVNAANPQGAINQIVDAYYWGTPGTTVTTTVVGGTPVTSTTAVASSTYQGHYDGGGTQTTTTIVGGTTISTGENTPNMGFTPVGIGINGVRDAPFKFLMCPADPSAPANGLVNANASTWGDGWGYTNYLANYNAWTCKQSPIPANQVTSTTVAPYIVSDPIVVAYSNGQIPMCFMQSQASPWNWDVPINPSTSITDGLSNTIMFGEGYSQCDNISRVALNPWVVPGYSYPNASFGVDWNGYANTRMFQTNPAVQLNATKGCNNWAAQSGHRGGINVTMFDGSVRFLIGGLPNIVNGAYTPGITQNTWNNAMLPNDGGRLGADW